MYDENLEYYFSLENERLKGATMQKNIQQAISVLYRLNILVNKTYKQKELGKEIEDKFNKWQDFIQANGGLQ